MINKYEVLVVTTTSFHSYAVDVSMGKQDPQEEPDRDESPEVKGGKGGEGEPGPKKPGSKGQGRKRTKTGCLSELTSFVLLS